MFRAAPDCGIWCVSSVAKAGHDDDKHSLGDREAGGHRVSRDDMRSPLGPVARRKLIRGLLAGGQATLLGTQPVRQAWSQTGDGGAGLGAATWNPPVASGLLAHLDPSHANSLRTGGTERAPAYGTEPGGRVQGWKPRQGAQRAGFWTPTNDTFGRRPTWHDHLGGPAHGVAFGTSPDGREFGITAPYTSGFAGTSSFTVALAVTCDSGTLLGLTGGADLLRITANGLEPYGDAALAVGLRTPWVANRNQTRIVTVRSRAGLLDVYLDGTLLATRDCTSQAGRTAQLIAMNTNGYDSYGNRNGAVGALHDLFHYGVALSDGDLATLHTAMLARWPVRGVRKSRILIGHGQSNMGFLTQDRDGQNGGTPESRAASAAIRQVLGLANLDLYWGEIQSGDTAGRATYRGGCALDVWVAGTQATIASQDNWNWTTLDVGQNAKNWATWLNISGNAANAAVLFYHNEYDAKRGPGGKAFCKALVKAFVRLVRRDASFTVPILFCGPMPYVPDNAQAGLPMIAEVWDEVCAELPACHRILRNLGDLEFSRDSGGVTFGNDHQAATDSIKVFHRLGRSIAKALPDWRDNAPVMGDGPFIASAVGDASDGTVDVTVTHDGGTDLVVPALARSGRGWRVRQGRNSRTVTTCARLNATTLRLTVTGMTAGAATLSYAEQVAEFWSGLRPPLGAVLVTDNTDRAGPHPVVRAGFRVGLPLHRRTGLAFMVTA